MIHGHKHFDCEINYGRSTIVGIRGLDPDKVFGLPSITIFDFNDNEYFKYGIEYPLDIKNLYDFKDYIGISCYNMEDFLDYAINNKINNIEIRLRKLPTNINYVSFFMAWSKKDINHAPVFLEMSTIDNCKQSLEALDSFYIRDI